MNIYQRIRIAFYKVISKNFPDECGRLRQPVLFLGSGKIVIGKGTTIGFFPSPHFLSGYGHLEARGKSSQIVIGENNHINNSVVIISEFCGVFIGDDCHIGSCVEIIDSDFHSLAPEDRALNRKGKSKSVIISDNVFIGSNVKILKGVTIGSGAVIANGSVVFSSVPAGATVYGNPAVLYKK